MIKILKSIYSILQSSTGVTDIVGNRIFPDIVPDLDDTDENIDYPLIIMRRSSINPENTKCLTHNYDTAIVEIICYSISYFNVVDLAEEVRNTLDFYKGEVEGFNITYCRMTGITEDYVDGAYYQLLTFSIK